MNMDMETIVNYEYLRSEHFYGFDKYKYNAKDTSPLSVYVMHPFWNWLVQFCPSSIAPNTLTFVGFLFSAANFVLLSWYDWNFYASSENPGTTQVPSWVWLSCAINIFLAYTLDGIDGKQARKLSLSGPLGELFDHGLDSYTAVLIPVCLFSIFGRCAASIPTIRMFCICWMVFFNFFISHWEKYNTGILYLPWGYDLSMWGSTFLYLITWHYGIEFWKQDLPFGLHIGTTMESFLHISAMSNIPMVIYNVYTSYKYKTGKLRSFNEAARPMYPFLLFMILLWYWAYRSPSNIVEKDPRVLFLLSGTIFSNISCRLIVSQMSNTRCEAFHWMTPIYVISMMISFYIPILERLILYLLCIFTTLTHWHYGAKVVQQMCKHFNRICFSVHKLSDTNDIVNMKLNSNANSNSNSNNINNKTPEHQNNIK